MGEVPVEGSERSSGSTLVQQQSEVNATVIQQPTHQYQKPSSVTAPWCVIDKAVADFYKICQDLFSTAIVQSA